MQQIFKKAFIVLCVIQDTNYYIHISGLKCFRSFGQIRSLYQENHMLVSMCQLLRPRLSKVSNSALSLSTSSLAPFHILAELENNVISIFSHHFFVIYVVGNKEAMRTNKRNKTSKKNKNVTTKPLINFKVRVMFEDMFQIQTSFFFF